MGYYEIGAVEGVVNEINGLKLLIKDDVSRVEFPVYINEEQKRKIQQMDRERRVSIAGHVYLSDSGHPISVENVSNIEIMPLHSELPTYGDCRGILQKYKTRRKYRIFNLYDSAIEFITNKFSKHIIRRR